MPPKKFVGKRKVVSKKRNYKKKGISIKNSTSIGKELTLLMKSPIPIKYTGRFRYAQTISLATGTAGVLGTQQIFRLNNLFDPDYTGSGHQPYGLDQVGPLYGKYQVNSVKVTLMWHTSGGAAELMGCYKCQVNTNAGNLTGISCDYATEQPQTATCLISGDGNLRVVEQNFTVQLHKLFNVTKSEYKDSNYIADGYGASYPESTAQLLISVGSPAGNAGQTIVCQVILDYNATLFGRIDQAQS